jgi:hypothetical protein
MGIIRKGQFKAIIEQDENPWNPRENDNLGSMFCQHGRYILGDDDAVHPNTLTKKETAVILPLYLYDHSGITMRTHPFDCQWDSGQVGWIYGTRKKLREEWGVKRLNDQHIAQAMRTLIAEVAEYDQYLTGDVYRYTIEDGDGNVVDSCSGFYGFDHVQIEAQEALDYAYDTRTREKASTIAVTANVPSRAAQRFWRMNNAPA